MSRGGRIRTSGLCVKYRKRCVLTVKSLQCPTTRPPHDSYAQTSFLIDLIVYARVLIGCIWQLPMSTPTLNMWMFSRKMNPIYLYTTSLMDRTINPTSINPLHESLVRSREDGSPTLYKPLWFPSVSIRRLKKAIDHIHTFRCGTVSTNGGGNEKNNQLIVSISFIKSSAIFQKTKM